MPERKDDPEGRAALSRSTRILPPTEADYRVFEVDRRRARASWERLRPLPFTEQTALVDRGEELHNWALAELLCDENAKATATGRGQEALQLAKLALRIAALA